MTRRFTAMLAIATLAILVGACGGTTASPALTDPTEIVTAALKSTEAAKSFRLDVRVDGSATIRLPGSVSGTGTPVRLDGTTAAIDVDVVAPAAHAIVSAPALLGFKADVIAVDGKSYVKTSLTGPLYQVSAAETGPVNPGAAGSIIDNLGDLLLKEGIVLTKGADLQCGSETCYAVTTSLTPDQLGAAGGAAAALPVDLTGATLKLTMLVEQDPPNHLAGIDAVLTMADGSALTMAVTASRWDEPVTVTAPPADQVKPAS